MYSAPFPKPKSIEILTIEANITASGVMFACDGVDRSFFPRWISAIRSFLGSGACCAFGAEIGAVVVPSSDVTFLNCPCLAASAAASPDISELPAGSDEGMGGGGGGGGPDIPGIM